MRINDYFYFTFFNMKVKHKKNIINAILITISLIILITCISFSNSLKTAMNRALVENISYRSISVMNNESIDTESLIKEIEKVEHIVKVVPQGEYETYVDIDTVDSEEILGNATLFGANEDVYPSIINGRKIKTGETGVCIIPKNFYPFDLENYDESRVINGEQLIGKNIEIYYYSYDYSNDIPAEKEKISMNLKVVGVYDEKENMMNCNECFISYEDMSSIMEKRLEGNNYSGMEYQSVTAILDTSLNVDSVVNEITNMGYVPIVRSVVNTNLVNVIKYTSIVIVLIILIISVINMTISNIKNVNDQKYEIGILKAIGYNNSNIIFTTLLESIIIGIISFVISLVIAILMLRIIKNNIFSTVLTINNIDLVLDNSIIIIALVIALVIPIFSIIPSIKKITKQSIVTLSKES